MKYLPDNHRLALARAQAFTLVELVIVVMILGILAGVAAPRFLDSSVNTQASTMLANTDAIFDAAELIMAREGRWPNNTGNFEFPQEFEGYLPRSLFLQNTPIAGPFNWNGPGTSFGHIGVSVLFPDRTNPQDLPVYTEMESLADDGDATTGWIQSSGRRIFFQLAELPED